MDDSFENLKRFVLSLLVRASRGGELPFVWFWPEGKESCLVLTHDVESSLAGNSGIWRLIDAEKTGGFQSSFNVVPFKYEVAESEIERIRAEGCEVGVHGYSHGGDLFSADIKDATVVTLYLLPGVNMRLRPKLLSDLRPGTRIVSHSFDMGDWKPEKKVEINGRTLYFWHVPKPAN